MPKLIKIKRSDGSIESVTERELEALNEKKKLKRQFLFIKKQRNGLFLALLLSWLIFPVVFFNSRLFTMEKDTAIPLALPLSNNITAAPIATNYSEKTVDANDAIEEETVTTHAGQPVLNSEHVFDQQDISQAIHQWANAWSDQDHARYIATYSENFIPDNKHLTYETWIAHRKKRIASPDWIRVTITDIDITPPDDNGLVITQFKQDYLTNSYQDHTLKKLVFKQEKGKWLILSEASISQLAKEKQ